MSRTRRGETARLVETGFLLPEDASVEASLAGIRRRLPQGLVVELPDAQSGRADTMISAFQFNLSALSAVSLHARPSVAPIVRTPAHSRFPPRILSR